MKEPSSPDRNPIYEQWARLGKALASPKRLELLELLIQGARTVEKLAQLTRMSIANTSQHLRVLHAARLVETEKKGLYVTYRPGDPAVSDLLRSLRRLAETRLAEVQRIAQGFAESQHGFEAVDQRTLARRIKEGSVVLLDVRPHEEYLAGHIAGAISVPIEELAKRMKALPHRRGIVAYCRGPYCLLAVKAVELLRARKFRAYRLEASVQDWRARGGAVVSGDAK